MAETKGEEHARLQRRTNHLKQEHAGLARDRIPFSQRDHDRHNENLRKHKEDLAEHKARDDDERE